MRGDGGATIIESGNNVGQLGCWAGGMVHHCVALEKRTRVEGDPMYLNCIFLGKLHFLLLVARAISRDP
jgi:hypothetical protein